MAMSAKAKTSITVTVFLIQLLDCVSGSLGISGFISDLIGLCERNSLIGVECTPNVVLGAHSKVSGFAYRGEAFLKVGGMF